MAGATAVAMRRAARFGRAPSIHDLTFAFTLWGFLGDAPADLIAERRPLFRSASHHYELQREIADRVRDEALRLTPDQVREALPDWRRLLTAPGEDDSHHEKA
jgi:hypothetical protein